MSAFSRKAASCTPKQAGSGARKRGSAARLRFISSAGSVAPVCRALRLLHGGVKLAPFALGAAAYALTVNINRRHMTKGQRAMVTAMAYPEPIRSKRHSSKNEELKDVHAGMLSSARTVLRVLPVKAAEVVAGTKALADAYAEASVMATAAHREA
jgi:hypothetical protein